MTLLLNSRQIVPTIFLDSGMLNIYNFTKATFVNIRTFIDDPYCLCVHINPIIFVC